MPQRFVFPLDWKKEFWGPLGMRTHDTLKFFTQCVSYFPEGFPFDVRAHLFS